MDLNGGWYGNLGVQLDLVPLHSFTKVNYNSVLKDEGACILELLSLGPETFVLLALWEAV